MISLYFIEVILTEVIASLLVDRMEDFTSHDFYLILLNLFSLK